MTRQSEPPLKLPATSGYADWVHAGWADKRSKVYDGLTRTAQTNPRRYAFATCAADAMIQRRTLEAEPFFEFRPRATRCHDRFCDPCAALRAWDIQKALHTKMTAAAKPMLITLTLVSKPSDALAPKIDELYRAFKCLRAATIWEDHVNGGAAFLEITRGKDGDRWHVHFHVVCDADYMDFYKLQAVWKGITNGAFRVRLERPKAADGVAYSAKYAAKGIDFNVVETPDLLDETIIALKGRRLAFCFGDWYGTSFDHEIEEEKLEQDDSISGGWSTWTSFANAVASALAGDAYFIAALNSFPSGRHVLERAASPPV